MPVAKRAAYRHRVVCAGCHGIQRAAAHADPHGVVFVLVDAVYAVLSLLLWKMRVVAQHTAVLAEHADTLVCRADPDVVVVIGQDALDLVAGKGGRIAPGMCKELKGFGSG
jgi:hypothetical protein